MPEEPQGLPKHRALMEELNRDLVSCRLCPRLVEWRESVAAEKRKSFREWTYWAKPIPNFGDPDADRLIVGLAPAAHGGNRTGRMFTGDRSGDWLFAALYRAGIANQPQSVSLEDGLELKGVLITASVHCAPPANKPLPSEFESCSRYLNRLLPLRRWKSILCLGGAAWTTVLKALEEQHRPKFGHCARYRSQSGILVVGSYHPSQQNTFTGKLTERMFDEAISLFLEKPR